MDITQAYAPKSVSEEEELETFYDNKPAHNTILTADFKAKIGRKLDKSEKSLRKYGNGAVLKTADNLEKCILCG